MVFLVPSENQAVRWRMLHWSKFGIIYCKLEFLSLLGSMWTNLAQFLNKFHTSMKSRYDQHRVRMYSPVWRVQALMSTLLRLVWMGLSSAL